ncbi:MAG: beta-galactosidase trimerization domain-containing protein [Acidobacteriota bacterium]
MPSDIVEFLVLEGAEAVAAVRGGGKLTGRPAITCNRYGKGWAFYAGADRAEEGLYETLARSAASACAIKPLIEVPYGVEVVSRQDAGAVYYFLLNLTPAAQGPIRLARPMDECISSKAGLTHVLLGPLDVVILAEPITPA